MAKVSKLNVLKSKNKLIERTIYYYELRLEVDSLMTSNEKFIEGMNCLEVLAHNLIEFVKPENNDRFFISQEKHFLIKNIEFNSLKYRIQGEILLVRKDIFPEIINMIDDKVKSFDTDEDDGVSEKTHFIIEFREGRYPILAVEHNQFGAKFTDLCQYLTRVGIKY